MPREVALRLENFLEEQAPGTTRAELADRLGISKTTLGAYFEDRWTVLDRTVLERLADFFQCDASSLLTTVESHFFDPFQQQCGHEIFHKPTCLYLSRPDADVMEGRRALAHRDHLAMKHVGTLLRNEIDDLAEFETSATTLPQFQEHLQQNCVVLGSPIVNPAAEIAICHAFGVEPFSPGQNRKLPFTFRRAEGDIARSSIVELSADGRQGIWLRKENQLLEVDRWPPEEFRKNRIDRGRDCAVVIVLNNPMPGPPEYVRKLIVLSGFSGAATEMAAAALSAHYRDLEPRNGTGPVWGVIEVFYGKAAKSTERKDLTYNWRYRVGGRCPVAFVRPRR